MHRTLLIAAAIMIAGVCRAERLAPRLADPRVSPRPPQLEARWRAFLPDLAPRTVDRFMQPAEADISRLLSEELFAWLGLPPHVKVQVVIGRRPEIWLAIAKV